MKTKQFIYAAFNLSCCLAIITGCSGNEEEIQPKENVPVGITASVSGEVQTKADVTYAPADGEKKIYVYYKNGGNTVGTEKGIFNYSSTWNADAEASAGHQIFWDDLSAVSTKYPFFAISPKDVGVTAVELNQNTANNLTNSDILMAFTDATAKFGSVNLVFKHMLSKLTVTVNVAKVANPTSLTVTATIKNAISNYTVNYTTPAPTTAVPATVTSGTTPRKDITPKTNTGVTGNTREYSAVLPVQTIKTGETYIEIQIKQGSDTNTYTFKPDVASAITLVQAKETKLTLTVNGTKVDLGTIQVTNWDTTTASGNITIDKP